MHFPLPVPVVFAFLAAGCSGARTGETQSGYFRTSEVQARLREIVPSVVGVGGSFRYRVTTFRYAMLDDRPVHDPLSPTGYKLLAGEEGMVTIERTHDTQGCGLIIHKSDRMCAVLTSHHILLAPDTSVGYYRDARGRITDLLSFRAIKLESRYYVIDSHNNFVAARIIRADKWSDLGLLRSDVTLDLGREFPYSLAQDLEPTWGDFAYVFGYPHSSKQVTTAVVSPSVYPGSFAVDAVARYGFSGGPVIVVRSDGSLDLGGVIRSVPATKKRYVAPPPELPAGSGLIPEDLAKSSVEEEDVIEYGSAFAVGAQRIAKFLQESAPELANAGIVLSSRFALSKP